MNINKETKLYGSFAKEAGNRGNEFFNAAFQKYSINAIYKSFSVNSFGEAFSAAKTLDFSGFGVAIPFKLDAAKCMIRHDQTVLLTGVINTVIKNQKQGNHSYTGYNTDYIGVKQILEERGSEHTKLIVIGNGGLARTVRVTWEKFHGSTVTIDRRSTPILENISGAFIYNCSPGDYSYLREKNDYIDCRLGTPEGDKLYEIQSKAQFKLYTGIDYES